MTKMREVKVVSAETRAKMSAAKKGKTFSAEHIANLTASRKKFAATDEYRAKLSAAKKGKTLTAEHRANISAGMLKNKSISG